MKFTDKQAMDALRSVVAQYGENHVTPNGAFSCRFWDVENDCPSDLIGTALTHLGISKDELIAEDAHIGTFVVSKFGEEGAYFSRAIVTAFNEAQWWQDCGVTWGVALFKAEKKYKECAS